MKSIYDIINEGKDMDSVWVVKGPDDTIISVWASQDEAKEDCEKQNKEAGGKVFTIEKDKSNEFMK